MLKTKKLCTCCNKYPRFSKGLCKYCWNREYAKPINKISASMQEILDEYKPERKQFLEENPYCQLKLKGCTFKAECIHHKKGKHSKELYLDKKFWKSSCIYCNGVVETLGEEAYRLGLKIRHNSK